MTQNLKNSDYLRQNFMEVDMEKKSDSKSLAFGIWDLKTRLGQFGSKAFVK